MREKFHEGTDIPKRDLEQKWREKDKIKRILVIDDEPLLIDLLTNLLTLLGYQVDSALDYQEAFRELKNRKYDLIFLDMKMPLMDGKRFYLKIKEYIPTLAKRIVFLTGDVGNKETIDFILETQNLYLGKPFTIKEVRGLLTRFFNPSEKS